MGNGNNKVVFRTLMQVSLTKKLLAILFFCFTTFTINANQLQLSNLFSDHMVLQREMPVPVWGVASPGEEITVSFAGQTKTTTTGQNGKWKVMLDALVAAKVGKSMTISGNSQVIINDVLVGEVWICSGQSNMQLQVNGVPEIRALVPFQNNIRSFEVPKTVSFNEEDNINANWQTVHPNSAVAFSFAFFLEAVGDIPVGIIHASWGSSSIEAWMPKDMGEKQPYFKKIMNEFDNDTISKNRISDIIAKGTKRTRQEDIFLRRQPNILYNAMMKPLAPFAVRGLVWYQGERNSRYFSGVPEVNEQTWFHKVIGMREYGDVLTDWVQRYRSEWQNDNMNFMVVMLPGYGKGTMKADRLDPNSPTAESWAWMRESQMKVLNLPHTKVANTIDLGDVNNIHPKDKLPIGQRLALLAAKYTLNKDIVAEGPIMQKVDIEGDSLVVHFSNAIGLKTKDGKSPRAFWLSDGSGEWHSAEAKIKGKSVLLQAKEVQKPLYVRYAFAGKPDVNLINQQDLPAYPFRTDE